MTRTQKIHGFRLGSPLTKWIDIYGNHGFKVIRLIPLRYCTDMQVVISNGDILTSSIFNAKDIPALM